MSRNLCMPAVVSTTSFSCPNSFQLLFACRPQFLRPRRRTIPACFSISSTRGWGMTPTSALNLPRRLYLKASSAGQHNSTDPEIENDIKNSSAGGRGGVSGTTLAAFLLAAAVASAIVFIKNQTSLSRTKQVEISTPRQEEFLDTSKEKGDDDDRVRSTDRVDDIGSLQNVTGISDEISPSMKVIDGSKELQFVDVGTIHEFSSIVESESTDNAPIQDVTQDKLSLGNLPLGPDENLNLDCLPGEEAIDDSVIPSQSEESDVVPFPVMLEHDSDTVEDFVIIDSTDELPTESYTNSLNVDEPTELFNVNTQTPADSDALSETNTSLNFHVVVNDGTENGSSVMLSDVSNMVEASTNTVDENGSFLEARELHEIDPSEIQSVNDSSITTYINGDRESNNSTLFVEKHISQNRVFAGVPAPSVVSPALQVPLGIDPSEIQSVNDSSITTYINGDRESNNSTLFIEKHISQNRVFAGVPAPSVMSPALQVPLGKIVVPAVIDQLQSQALTALQVLKIIEADAQPGDICTRREFSRWLVTASSVLSRSTISKVYPAMYIENVTELAFDDVTPDDPDFPSIQGLAEAGLIASKLSQGDALSSGEDKEPFIFSPESPLSRQDLVSWKIALETRKLPEADRKTLYQASGFVDIDRIDPAAWPALVADLASGDQGIIPLAFGYTRLFQPAKPVTKSQAAIALAVGESSDVVNEELARIEAESMAENAVAEHSALVAQVEKDLTDNFEKKLQYEREMITAVEKMAEEAKQELEKIRSQREEDKLSLMKEKAAAELEMKVLSKLKREVDTQLYDILSNKVEISYEKERIIALRKEVEAETQEIGRLQHELEIERKALSMARAWAEDEAKKAKEQAKALEEARGRWERQGIQIVVDEDLRQDAVDNSTWVNAGKVVAIEETSSRAEILIGKLKTMANDVSGKARVIITMIIDKIVKLISALKEKASNLGRQSEELKEITISKARESTKVLQQSTAEFTYIVTEGVKGVAEDCKGGVKKLTQRFNNKSS